MAQKKRYGFVIDISRCIDCRACLVACSAENNVGMKYTRIWVRDTGVKGEFPKLQRTFVPYNCMHCENPPCTQVCVSGATYKDKDTGLVLVDQEACIGCGYCGTPARTMHATSTASAAWWTSAPAVSSACRWASNRLVSQPVSARPACSATLTTRTPKSQWP